MPGWTDKLRAWLLEGKAQGATHVIIVCDTFDHEDFPVYVKADQDVRKFFDEWSNKQMHKVMEVYSLKQDIESQLAEDRAFHFD